MKLRTLLLLGAAFSPLGVTPAAHAQNSLGGSGLTIGGVLEIFPPSGLIVGETDTQPISNKTITLSTIDSTPIGVTTPADGYFNNLHVATSFTWTGPLVSTSLTFGSVFASGPTDLSHHIALYSTTYGLDVTSSRLNIVAPSSADVFFNIAGTDVGYFSSTGLNATSIGLTTPEPADFTSVFISGAGNALSVTNGANIGTVNVNTTLNDTVGGTLGGIFAGNFTLQGAVTMTFTGTDITGPGGISFLTGAFSGGLSSGSFSTGSLTATGVTVSSGTISASALVATASLSVSGSVSGSGFNGLFSSPPAIGLSSSSSGNFTSLSASQGIVTNNGTSFAGYSIKDAFGSQRIAFTIDSQDYTNFYMAGASGNSCGSGFTSPCEYRFYNQGASTLLASLDSNGELMVAADPNFLLGKFSSINTVQFAGNSYIQGSASGTSVGTPSGTTMQLVGNVMHQGITYFANDTGFFTEKISGSNYINFGSGSYIFGDATQLSLVSPSGHITLTGGITGGASCGPALPTSSHTVVNGVTTVC